jgi:hypothetical protein
VYDRMDWRSPRTGQHTTICHANQMAERASDLDILRILSTCNVMVSAVERSTSRQSTRNLVHRSSFIAGAGIPHQQALTGMMAVLLPVYPDVRRLLFAVVDVRLAGKDDQIVLKNPFPNDGIPGNLFAASIDTSGQDDEQCTRRDEA